MKFLAVIPAITHTDNDILYSQEGADLLQGTITTLCETNSVLRILVIINSKRIRHISKRLVEYIWTDACLPYPVHHASLYAYSKILPPSLDFSNILIVSPRNPFLTSNILNDAIAKHEANSLPLLTSVVASSMHPCQLFEIKTFDTKKGTIFLPDKKQNGEMLFFPAVPGLWQRDQDGMATNLLTGKQILGRQNFPETVEPDGSFIVTKKSYVDKPNLVIDGKLYGYRLPQERSLLIYNKFDFLRYRVLERTQQFQY